ncbi:hypothetical protein D3C87_295550 [compost metagenome]
MSFVWILVCRQVEEPLLINLIERISPQAECNEAEDYERKQDCINRLVLELLF